MASKSTQWHLERRKKMIDSHPEIALIPRHNSLALIPIVLAPIAHFFLAYSCQYLSLALVCLMAWLFGSLCSFSMFNYSHELSHNLVHPKIKGRLYEYLLHYASCLSVSPSIYILFRFGHKPHHASLGDSSVASANRFLSEKHPDIELLIDRYYYELIHEDGEKPRSLTPFVFNNKLLRLLSVSLYFPLSGAIKGVFLAPLALMVAFIKSLLFKKEKHTHQRINAICIQLLLLYSLLFTLNFIAGPVVLLYLFLSEASQRGLLFHPIMIFPMASHKRWQHRQFNQPTTSTYHWLVSLILMNLNYHVEHHDFPDIPCRYLPRLKKIAPEFYEDLTSFKGIVDVYKQYYQSPHWYYAGGQ